MDINVAREITARIWCDQEMPSVVMDVELAEEIAQLLSSRLTKEALDGATPFGAGADAMSKNIAWRDGFTNPPSA